MEGSDEKKIKFHRRAHMKFVVLGTTDFTIQCACALLDAGCNVVAMVSMPASILPNNSADIYQFARTHRIPYHEIADINSSAGVSCIQQYAPDYLFSSWPHVVNQTTLKIPRRFCIGTHPTELPHNRGRHPLHWLAVLGILTSKLSFFRMDEQIDTGNILHQEPFSYAQHASIGEVMEKVNAAAYDGTRNLYAVLLKEPDYVGIQQDGTLANYWRKRTPHDVTLDLRMSSSMIIRTVRSFAPPFPCAILIFEGDILRIKRASVSVIDMPADQAIRTEPGRIIKVEDRIIRVKAEDAVVDLECVETVPSKLKNTKYVHPPSKYIAEWPAEFRSQFT